MKRLAPLATLFALSASAADYDCTFIIDDREGQTIGVMMVGQDVGESYGTIATLPIYKRKNMFGKTVETVEATLDGRLFNGGESSGETGIDATLSLVTKTDRRGIGSRTNAVSKVGIAKIQGLGPVKPTSLNAGYVVRGECHVNE